MRTDIPTSNTWPLRAARRSCTFAGQLAFALLFVSAAVSQVAHFESAERRHFDVLPLGTESIAGDLDGDGTLDLVFLHELDAEVYLNSGHAFFRRDAVIRIDTDYDAFSTAIVLLDLDGNGTVELVSAGGTDVSTYRRTSSGFTTARTSLPSRALLRTHLVAGDFDEDGDADVLEFPWAIAGAAAPNFLESRGGTLVLRPDLGSIPSAVFVCACSGHFDADSHRDVVAMHGGAVMLYRGRGDGTFTAPTRIATLPPLFGAPLHCVAADLDGDGDLDVAYAGLITPLQFLRNDGSTFTQVLTNIPTQGISGVLDVDMDGIEEVLRPGFFLPSRDAAWFGIDPINGLTRQGTVPTIMRGAWLGRCGVGDFDNDGDTDIAGLGGRLLLHADPASTGENGWQMATVYNPNVAVSMTDVRHPLGNGIPVLPTGLLLRSSSGNGEFLHELLPATPNPAVDAAFMPATAAAFPLLLVADGQLHVGAPLNPSSWLPGISPLPLSNVHSVAATADWAVATCSDFAGGLAILRRSVAGIATDTQVSSAIPQPRFAAPGWDRILVADLDDDGLTDIVHSFRWLRGTSTGAFVDAGDIVGTVPSNPRDLAAIDFDGDGDRDLVLGRLGYDMLLELRNGQFVEATVGHLPPESTDCTNVTAGDFDGDGDDDLLVAGPSPARLLRNDGGIFHVAAGAPTDAQQLFDVDGDGDADLLAGRRILRNTVRQLTAPRLPLLGASYELNLRWHPVPGTSGLGAVFHGLPLTQTVPGVRGQLQVDPATASVWIATPLLVGESTFTQQVPATATLFGLEFVAQGLLIENGSPILTNAIFERVQ